MLGEVDTGHLVVVADAEADGGLDGVAEDQGDDERVRRDAEGAECLVAEDAPAAAVEQPVLAELVDRRGGEEAEVQGSNEATDEVSESCAGVSIPASSLVFLY